MSDDVGDSVDDAWSLDDAKSADGFERTWDELVAGLQPGDVIDEKYRLEGLVGHGAMGYVLSAWHLQLDEPVAVKFLLPELLRDDEARGRFEREARAAFKIRSEHVTRVLDVGRLPEGDQPFIVMELLEGKDLGELVDAGALPYEEAVDYLLQACHAVAEAHSLGIVHRDLKPDNLFRTRRPNGSPCIKVLDFGLSKLRERREKNGPPIRERALTRDAQIMGTAHYMSPEQWVAAKNVGPAADQWALGVILYEAITGDSPFFRNNIAAMCNAVLREDPPPMDTKVRDVPPELEAVVRRCFAKKVDERWPSVDALAEALRPFAPETLAPPPSRRSAPRRSALSGSHTDLLPDLAHAPTALPPQTDVMIAPVEAHAPTEKPPPASASRPLPKLGLRDAQGAATWTEVNARGSQGKLPLAAFVLLVVIAAAAWFATSM